MGKPKEIILNGAVSHCSVGAVVESEGKYLLIERATPPPGFAGVAGHIDEDESPEQALLREVEEEVGLKIQNYELLSEEFIDWNWCRRGVTGHTWYLFKCKVSGDIKHNYRETKSVDWYAKDEVQKLKLEPVWEYWFKKLEII